MGMDLLCSVFIGAFFYCIGPQWAILLEIFFVPGKGNQFHFEGIYVYIPPCVLLK